MPKIKIKFDCACRWRSVSFPVCFEFSKSVAYIDGRYQLIISFLLWAARWYIWIDRKERGHE